VVPHLEQVYRPGAIPHLSLGGKSRVAGEQGLEGTILDQQDEGVFVDVLAPSAPGWIGMKNGEGNPVQDEPLITAGSVPPNVTGSELVEKGIVERVSYPLARLYHHLSVEPIQHAGDTAKMVRVGVGNDNHLQLPGPLTGQERNNHSPPRIAVAASWTRIDQDPTPRGGPQDGPISLPHIEKM
jgi:hypothetical protein